MLGSFRIGKIAGIEIDINVSWIVILVLLTVSLATGWFPLLYPGWSTATYWVVSFISALLLFVSVLLHELAHSLVARRSGLPVKNITLFIFGGVSNIEQEPKSPGVEFRMAFVGPLTSLLIGAVCYLLLLPLRGTHSPLEGILFYLAVMNILLGLFNLIPGFPLDGGGCCAPSSGRSPAAWREPRASPRYRARSLPTSSSSGASGNSSAVMC